MFLFVAAIAKGHPVINVKTFIRVCGFWEDMVGVKIFYASAVQALSVPVANERTPFSIGFHRGSLSGCKPVFCPK